ncbi:MAG: RHS repeat protein, partial [Clostridia bacterium]|nr:RHS repeat protein [Clostridia bacterium]
MLTARDNSGTVTRQYDALSRITKLTDTAGNVIEYRYDEVGNLIKLIYPDNTEVVYTYDANNNLVSVKDWANRTTVYSYDENNKVVGVVKPDGSTAATVYDDAQRVISTVERTAQGTVIVGFEYEYDSLGRIICEKHLAKNEKICYTYDELSRVTKKLTESIETGEVLHEETYSYDAAGNVV